MFPFIGSLAGVVQAADVALFKFINTGHTPFFDFFFSLFTNLGYGWVVFPPLLVLLLWKAPGSIRLGRGRVLVAAVVSLLFSGLGNAAVKEIVGRSRPAAYFIAPGAETATTPGPTDPSRSGPEVRKGRVYNLHLVDKRPYKYSFPSGHTQTAFAVAAILTLIFGSRLRWTFLVAAMVGYSRIYLGVHFPIDTVAGAVFGWGLVRAAWPAALSIGRKKPPQTAAGRKNPPEAPRFHPEKPS